jgi:hypothetical protein
MANVKAIYLDSNGVYRPAGSSDTIDVGDIKLLNQTTADGVLSTDASGNVSSAKLTNANVDASAAIDGSKIDPNFGSQNIVTTGTITADSISGDLNADDLTSGTVASGRISGSYTGITGVGTLTSGAWNASAISDTYLSQITAANKVASSANPDLAAATDADTSGTLVKRDGSGDFAAGTITADLSGNASTASAWANSRSVSFAGGDVTGSFSIKGDADVSNVDLTIAPSAVTNDMLAGSISNAKLLTISAANLVSDSALSSNVALLNRNDQTFTGTTPSFSNALSVGAPTQNGHAATKLYVDDAVAAAEAGLDYKQEAQWYWDLANNGDAFSEPATKDGFLAGINGQGINDFAAGDRILLNNSSAAAADVGIWVFAGASPNYTLSRASDMAAGTSATGVWVYCLRSPSDPNPVAVNQAYVCNTPAPASVGTTAIQFVLYAAGQTYTAASPLVMNGTQVSLTIGNGLSNVSNALVASAAASGAIDVSGSGIAVNVDDTTIEINGSNDIAFKSLPAQFKISGSAVSTDVTAANLDTLVDGLHSNADALHAHSLVESAFARSGAAISDGLAVSFDGSTVAKAQKSAGAVVGIVTQDLGSSECFVATAGVVKITNLFGAPSAGSNVYLYTDGKLCGYSNLSSGDYVTKVGRYLGGIGPAGADMIAIEVQEFGIKP